MDKIAALREKLNFAPDRPDRLSEALTHRSFAVENNVAFDNQRLEFLGDAVLEIILTDHLFGRYPDLQEGDLTKIRSALVRESTLAEIAGKLELGSLLRIGKGEASCGGAGRASTLADLLEAVIGALYLNAGFEVTRKTVADLFASHCPDPVGLVTVINPKGALQEYSQKHFGRAPEYHVLAVTGPEHLPDFTVEARLANYTASGSGNSRKSAECDAARHLLEYLKKHSITGLQ